ncbi:MAG TPA: GNAT family N-acetyltransferase [Anaerolineae bacterium]|nr:GNAT family N-acetyltransferase [Anaerolineae bacterium]
MSVYFYPMNTNQAPLTLRPFCPADQDAVKALILAGLVEHWGFLDPTLNPDLNDIAASYADAVFLTAWLDAELVGAGALIHEAEGVARIVRMSVAREKRRIGIGQAILRQLCKYARSAGYRQIVLETTSTWEDVIAFYERFGFRRIGAWDGDTHFVLDEIA